MQPDLKGRHQARPEGDSRIGLPRMGSVTYGLPQPQLDITINLNLTLTVEQR